MGGMVVKGVDGPIKRLGAWLARATDTTYQATTDGFVSAFTVNNGQANFKTDGATPPTVFRAGCLGTGTVYNSFGCLVKKGDYWRVSLVGGAFTVFWLPLEP